jgi:hypothetical protein
MKRPEISAHVLARVAIVGLVLVLGGCSGAGATQPTSGASGATAGGADQVFFDDFSYAAAGDMTAHGWIVRNKAGWPGVSGAVFDSSTVGFVPDLAGGDGKVLQIQASTDGTTTHESQICQQRKFLSGTFAARVFFNDAPTAGADGDQVVETFYLISPYTQPNDPNYSEVDNEYLPNGGWGGPALDFYVTTWHTVTIQPWSADNVSNNVAGSLQGWHTLVVQIVNQQTTFYLDGKQIAQHVAHTYPRVPMSLNFNLWLIDGALVSGGGTRTYTEQIDWVYSKTGVAMSPDEVAAAVSTLRSGATAFTDTVPPSGLDSPCDL